MVMESSPAGLLTPRRAALGSFRGSGAAWAGSWAPGVAREKGSGGSRRTALPALPRPLACLLHCSLLNQRSVQHEEDPPRPPAVWLLRCAYRERG